MASIRFSLRTHDPNEAKRRHAKAAETLEAPWAALRKASPVSPDHQQVTALAGELYGAVGGWQREPNPCGSAHA